MVYQIDQSGKIEQTNKETVITISNSNIFTVKISAKIKRRLQEVFRRQGKTKIFVYRCFAASVFLLLKTSFKNIHSVTIDTEYPGKEIIIKDVILQLFRKEKRKAPRIYFARIGNRPRVHYAAYDVFIGKVKANKNISFHELLKLTIKKDRGPKD